MKITKVLNKTNRELLDAVLDAIKDGIAVDLLRRAQKEK